LIDMGTLELGADGSLPISGEAVAAGHGLCDRAERHAGSGLFTGAPPEFALQQARLYGTDVIDNVGKFGASS
jgi:hypothetical protein